MACVKFENLEPIRTALHLLLDTSQSSWRVIGGVQRQMGVSPSLKKAPWSSFSLQGLPQGGTIPFGKIPIISGTFPFYNSHPEKAEKSTTILSHLQTNSDTNKKAPFNVPSTNSAIKIEFLQVSVCVRE